MDYEIEDNTDIDNMRTKWSNCYYCQKDLKPSEERRHQLKNKAGTGGDELIVCQSHYDILNPKENADG